MNTHRGTTALLALAALVGLALACSPAHAQDSSEWKEWSTARYYWEMDRDELEQERSRNLDLRDRGGAEPQLYQSDAAWLTPPPPTRRADPPPTVVADTRPTPTAEPVRETRRPEPRRADPEQERLERIEQARQAAIARKQEEFDARRATARARLESKRLEKKLLDEETNDQGQVVDDELKDLLEEIEE